MSSTLLRHTLALATLSTVACSDGPADPPDDEGQTLDGWNLVWQDDFDGAALDLTKWSLQLGDGCDIGVCDWGNNELQWYDGANATVGGGLLTITAREEVGNGKNYTSARLRTIGKGDWTYGRIDVRARLPVGRGLWPAIWMLSSDEPYGNWAASGEIDIMEAVGQQPSRVHGTLHYGGPWPNNVNTGQPFDLGSGTFADDFHTFGVEWEAGEIRWYVDGEHYQTQNQWYSIGIPFPAPFDQRFHLLLNVAVGGTWPGNPDETTTFPQTMEVDWVRVYEPAD